MIVLAIDPGSALGWALGADGRLIESGVEDFSLRRGESPGARYLRFRAWLHRVQQTHPVSLVLYEQAHHRGGHATEVAVGFTTRCQEFAAEIGAECVAIHTATLKKRTTGSGRADKAAMIAAARERWGSEPSDDNHADALCLLALGFEDYGGSDEPPCAKGV